MNKRTLRHFNNLWSSHGRPDQFPPETDWRLWLYLGGRATGVWTIGYGHTAMAGPPKVAPGMTISREEGRAILQRDVQSFADEIGPLIKVHLNANQFSALLSFAFNVGARNFARSSVLAYVNQKRFAEVPGRLALWTKAGGKVLRGLSRRRAAEGALFLRPPTEAEGRAETDEVQKAGRQLAQRQGKSALQSTTNQAAAGLTLALLIDQANEVLSLADRAGRTVSEIFALDWQALAWPLALSVLALGLCGWIIRERMKKSNEYGV